MKTWNKICTSSKFVCAGAMIGVATSNIQDCPWRLLFMMLAAATFMVYNGIDALKED